MKNTKTKPKAQKGFAVMSKARVKQIARMGGRAISKDTDYMALIGSIGGRKSRKRAKNEKKAT